MSKKAYGEIIALILVLLTAAFLRLYRIAELTEFLGDQGRTGIHIYEAWQKKELPLVGPTVLSGQHLGPAFYYLIAPSFILTNFNPLAPAVFTAFLGVGAVALLWFLSKKLFGWEIATMLAALWAVSPQIVSSDRVLWEPNMIPFFVFLFLLGLVKKWHVISGIVLGILMQLHYPNLLFVGLTFLFKPSIKIIFGFLLAVFPFFYYELAHGFEDILGVLTNFSSGGQIRFIPNILDYSSRVMHRLAPFPGTFFVLFLPILLKPTFWKIFVALWMSIGIIAMSLYRGVVFDHYLFFLIPAVFLLFGFLLTQLNRKLAIIGISILVLFHLSKTDINKTGINDIARTKSVSAEILRLADGRQFSFGLIASRSFSDLHYRYFFATSEKNPEPILSDTYNNLFLVCETDSCPSIKESVQIICYDAHCEGEYPKVTLINWKLASTTEKFGARLYQYARPL
ncbi:hypothetical protein A3A79_04700 [Candidatus Gottesmanbacteria bacterium RIFCSPLOWO2_01_FULL_43_11b]|uniref:Glycosyltransferase RgtA/B/C/D-like domain-containing protein n=1 Tax=Candidatus Gottesmanbacteria bacterium RIFCSPLOWO2_01_FULL_43_11b TaxID=1798392 RepID=A0A1F6AIB1_9BACT|nr:MAG: hypothetical protein A3A79_04700 [Candidatus Gottesmanbacteria bacterium RIFCSPLOWO2_01_FULL_43_11b]